MWYIIVLEYNVPMSLWVNRTSAVSILHTCTCILWQLRSQAHPNKKREPGIEANVYDCSYVKYYTMSYNYYYDSCDSSVVGQSHWSVIYRRSEGRGLYLPKRQLQMQRSTWTYQVCRWQCSGLWWRQGYLLVEPVHVGREGGRESMFIWGFLIHCILRKKEREVEREREREGERERERERDRDRKTERQRQRELTYPSP